MWCRSCVTQAAQYQNTYTIKLCAHKHITCSTFCTIGPSASKSAHRPQGRSDQGCPYKTESVGSSHTWSILPNNGPPCAAIALIIGTMTIPQHSIKQVTWHWSMQCSIARERFIHVPIIVPEMISFNVIAHCEIFKYASEHIPCVKPGQTALYYPTVICSPFGTWWFCSSYFWYIYIYICTYLYICSL